MMVFSTTSRAYLHALAAVMDHGELASPRGEATRELCDFGFKVRAPSEAPILTCDGRRNLAIARYTAAEFELYDSCTNEAAAFAKRAPLWGAIANPDGTVNSAYGHLIFRQRSCGHSQFSYCEPMTPWEWAIGCLLKDRDSRQAFLRFSLPEHQWQGNRDQVCTMHAHFRIRAGRLHMSVVMRSNDLVKGLVYDMPWFCSLLRRAVGLLKPAYPDLEAGSYCHFAHSAHVYLRDFALVNAMLGRPEDVDPAAAPLPLVPGGLEAGRPDALRCGELLGGGGQCGGDEEGPGVGQD